LQVYKHGWHPKEGPNTADLNHDYKQAYDASLNFPSISENASEGKLTNPAILIFTTFQENQPVNYLKK
jgi:hypothetical protein